jgi:hypothetical protein
MEATKNIESTLESMVKSIFEKNTELLAIRWTQEDGDISDVGYITEDGVINSRWDLEFCKEVQGKNFDKFFLTTILRDVDWLGAEYLETNYVGYESLSELNSLFQKGKARKHLRSKFGCDVEVILTREGSKVWDL